MQGRIEFGGLPWKEPGELATYGIDSLASHILCARHNAALSPLDAAAGRIFRNIQEICLDLNPHKKSLSRRGKWYLVSGEALELWCAKTLFGIFHAKLASSQRERLIETHTLDVNRFVNALKAGGLTQPCGLYLRAVQGGSILNIGEKVTACPLGSVEGNVVIGIRIGMLSFEFEVIIDPLGVDFLRLRQETVFHPWQLLFKNRQRRHMLVMTWPDSTSSSTIVDFATYRE